MKAPQNMTQVATDYRNARDYIIILPAGNYTSGTYTIPDGRTWNDFKMILGVLGRGTGQNATACGAFVDEQITSTSWVADMEPDHDSGSRATISRASATTFTVSRASTGQVNMLIGYLK